MKVRAMLNNLELNSSLLKREKNSTAKLTLQIRRHEEIYLSEMLKDKSDEEKLLIISEHLTNLYEVELEIRERQLATAKVQKDILVQIESLHSKEFRKWDKENPTSLVQKIEKSEQKRQDKFSKLVAKLRSLNLPDSFIEKSLVDAHCPDIQAVLKS